MGEDASRVVRPGQSAVAQAGRRLQLPLPPAQVDTVDSLPVMRNCHSLSLANYLPIHESAVLVPVQTWAELQLPVRRWGVLAIGLLGSIVNSSGLTAYAIVQVRSTVKAC